MALFSRKSRLKNKQDFKSVFAAPRKSTYRYLTALYTSNQCQPARLGIIINKQYVRLAITRNALRRVIRESFRKHEISAKRLDIVVLIRSEWNTFKQKTTKKHWRQDIDHLWDTLISKNV